MAYQGNKNYSKKSNYHHQENDTAVHKFINPYNFISIESCQKSEGCTTGNLTGYMNCKLTTKTPLIMIDSSNKKESKETEKHFIYEDTFKINGIPAIPASSLRGMIRSKFETLTNSCFSTADPQMAFVTRSKMTLGNGGLLHVKEGQDVKLYEAEKYKIQKSDRLNKHKSGDIVQLSFDRNDNMIENPKGNFTGIYREGEPFGKEQYNFIYFLMDEDGAFLPLNSDRKVEVKCEDDLLKLYNQSADFHKANKEQYQKRKIKDGKFDHASYCETEWRPVWWKYNEFSITEGHIYLSLSSNGQLEYGNHMGDLLSKKGKVSYLPCTDTSHICEACRVFGTIQEELSGTSKVQFGDALLQNNLDDYYAYSKKLITLPILGGPRYTNANFYLYSQDMIRKDFSVLSPDYKAKMGKKGSVDPKEYQDPIHIRGRKEYWHFYPGKYSAPEGIQNVTVSPLKEGLIYTFKVYFENLTREEFNHLYMSICLANDETHKYYHKLGMGKSLGFGSVKVDVEDIQVRKINVENGKIIRETESLEKPKMSLLDSFTTLSSQQKKEILCMYDFDYLNDKINEDIRVDYPREEKNGDIFQWFQKNQKEILPFSNQEIIQSASGKTKGKR